MCNLHDHGLSSEEICNGYAAPAVFCQSQAFLIENKPDFVWLFFISEKSQGVEKKVRISKSGFKKAILATLEQGWETHLI